MSQMNPQESAGYGHYEGNQYYSPQGQTYDDNFVEAVAQRASQRVMQQNTVSTPAPKASSGQRLALAIVSVAMLVPLAGILMNSSIGFFGLIGLGIVGAAIAIINLGFNGAFQNH